MMNDNSVIDGLNTLPAQWMPTTIGAIYKVIGGGTPSTSHDEYWGGDIPWITSADIKGVRRLNISRYVTDKGIQQSATNKVPPRTLLVVTRVGLGKIAISDGPICFSQDLQGLVQDPNLILPEYALYYLSFALERLKFEGRGTTISGLTKKQLKDTVFPLAPFKEQIRIVAKIEELFSELDKGVQNLETARQQLKVYRQAVLKHAFEGKFTEQWREENKDTLETGEQIAARLVDERKAHYQQELVQYRAAIEKYEAGASRGKRPPRPNRPPDLTKVEAADLPELPEGWIWLRFGELCSVIRNGIAQKPEGNTGEKIFRISAVRPMEFDLNDVRHIANTSGEFDDYYLRTGDLVFTRYNGSRTYVGVCAEYKGDGSHLYPDKLIRTQLATSVTLSGYIEKAVNCGASRHFIERRIRTTAGQSGISGSDIRGIPIPLCSPREQAIIRDRIDSELSKVSKLLSEIDDQIIKAEALRYSILKRAFSGRLVPQDPNDEPASVLLERIKAERARAVLPSVKESGNSRTTNTRTRTTVV
jgi:type I restriction enzyme, S subunit